MLRSRRTALAAALSVLLPALAVGCGQGAQQPARKAPAAAPGRFFSPRSFWNRPLATNTPLASGSAGLVSELRRLLAATNPWIDTWNFSTPIYRVGRHQRRVRVRLDRRYDPLAKAFGSVPLPASARPAPGDDRHLVVFQPSTETIWEFFKLRRVGRRWHAAWGGTHAHLSTAQRVGSAISVAFYALAILVVRRRAAGRTERRYRWAALGLVGILGLSALMNVASSSPWERYLLAPVALALAVLCAVVAYGARRSTARRSDDQPVAVSRRGSGTAAARDVARLGGTR